MADDAYSVYWTGQQAVVTLPQHIDVSNSDQIREQLLWIINRGATVLIADLTGTASCDYYGEDALARAHHRAAVNGTELRLVVTADVVRAGRALSRYDACPWAAALGRPGGRGVSPGPGVKRTGRGRRRPGHLRRGAARTARPAGG